ncbi:hypothetical protein LQ938_09530 [Microbacterium sp. cx-55]|nr:hypothetical protein [Microbacterium sp. cx-55]UGB34129.1 hypothetical protein LQ938_09530 [Microbacterium sp. cx-55]
MTASTHTLAQSEDGKTAITAEGTELEFLHAPGRLAGNFTWDISRGVDLNWIEPDLNTREEN